MFYCKNQPANFWVNPLSRLFKMKKETADPVIRYGKKVLFLIYSPILSLTSQWLKTAVRDADALPEKERDKLDFYTRLLSMHWLLPILP